MVCLCGNLVVFVEICKMWLWFVVFVVEIYDLLFVGL